MQKALRIGVVMDPIETINPKKDTSLAMMLEAKARGWEIEYMEMGDLSILDGRAEARMRRVDVFADPQQWFSIVEESHRPLSDLDIILMRKDPPFDIEYIMATYILEKAEADGVLVVNRPQSLRDANEKIFTAWFPQCCPPSLMTRSALAIKKFLGTHHKIVVKPTHKMGGQSIFLIQQGDPNTNVIIEEITQKGKCYVQAQAYIPEIATVGDKRILMIDGIPMEQGIARIPSGEDHRGNLAAGATAHAFTLTERDRWICDQVGPVLREKGLFFVGLDIIGPYLTEINVTSPTGAREIEKFFQVNAAALLMDALGKRLAAIE